ncbi:MAG TPA: ACP phosphodiesterase [Arachidicoccus sp.]
MNFLAHAYLSFNNPQTLTGNMMGDFVKGKQKDLFPEGIKRGIELHRFIDSFTDAHPVVYEAKKAFKSVVGRYAGAFVDISFDYFLANDIKEKTAEEWEIFAQDAYAILENQQQYFPERFARLFPYMREHDWLYNYRFEWGIENSFSNIIRRAKYLSIDKTIVFAVFQQNIVLLKESYDAFFPDLKNAVKNKL